MPTTATRRRSGLVLLGASLAVVSSVALGSPASADPPPLDGEPVPYELADCFGQGYRLPVHLDGDLRVPGFPPSVIFAEPGPGLTYGTTGDDVIVGTGEDDVIFGLGATTGPALSTALTRSTERRASTTSTAGRAVTSTRAAPTRTTSSGASARTRSGATT